MKRDIPASIRSLTACLALGISIALLSSCASTITVSDPVTELRTPQQSPRRYAAAIQQIDSHPMSDDELKAMRSLIHRPGYLTETREAALNVLADQYPKELFATIELHLPRLGALEWRRRLCEIIAERNWIDLTPTLIRGWVRALPGWMPSDFDRPEYLALAALHGDDGVIDAVFNILATENSVALQGLRTSCWSILYKLGHRDRLVDLLQNAAIEDDDGMMLDLRAAATDLKIIPANREEILWIRELRQPERKAFWEESKVVVSYLPSERLEELELRDLSILIAIGKHEPDLFGMSKADLYSKVSVYIDSQRRHMSDRDYGGYIGTNRQRLPKLTQDLTWGDLAAMLTAVRAMRVPEVVHHMFSYAEDDRMDKSTEYGGVIVLDSQHRFEIKEFPPRVIHHDLKFEAPQAMFDAGYSGVFHFHFHVQKYDNDKHAGPGQGDLMYADVTRANCLVLTFVDKYTLNVDYYRHGRVVVDLGEIKRTSVSGVSEVSGL